MSRRITGLILVLAMWLTVCSAHAEIIHYDPEHTEHIFSGDTCTVCGWMQPGFYMDGEMVLTWDELKSMGYVDVWEDGRLNKVVGNLEGRLVIGEEVTKVDGNQYPLFKDTPLQEVWIPRSVTELGGYLISRTSIREVRLFCPVTKLEDNVFCESLNKNANLEKVYLPDTVVEIGANAFERCKALKQLDLPDSLQKLGHAMLSETRMEQLTIPPNVIDVSSAFCESGLLYIKLPPSVEKLGKGAFVYSSAVTIDLSEVQIKELPDQCFQYCSDLENLILPRSLESFGWACFSKNDMLKRIVLPDGFKSLGSTRMDDVEEIVWPISLVDVNNAFPEKLKTILYRGTENQWKLNGANSKWDLSGVTVICNYTGD